jgi:thioesterase domain-containing protein
VARGPINVIDVAGDHNSMLRSPHVGGLAAKILALIDVAERH